MGKITRKSTDRKETPKPRRKRRKRDVNRIHSKILQAKRKLDDVGKNDNKAKHKKQSRKICERLLPEPAVGIYRNGAKGRNVQKAKTSENIFHEARLKADALKLFNGDSPESKNIVDVSIHDKTTKQSLNKDYEKDILELTPCILEQSPIIGKRSSIQKLCLVKKKGEENIFENDDSNKIKKHNTNDELRCVQREDICKRRLFQNDREQSKISSTEILDTIDLTKENELNEEETKQTCSKNSKNFHVPLNRYMEFCRIISAENFEVDILQDYHSDPVETTIKRLRNAYANSFRQQLLREKDKQGLENVEPADSIKYQACVSSNLSQLSPVEFEVPKCENSITTRLQQGLFRKNDKFHLIHNTEFKQSDDITHYNFTPSSSQNTSTYNINDNVIKNSEDNDIRCAKRSTDINRITKPMNFYFMNEKNTIQFDSHKTSNYSNHPKNKHHDKDNFSIDIPIYKNLRYNNNTKRLGTSFINDPILLDRHFLKHSLREKLSVAKLSVSDNCATNDISPNYNNKTSKCNMKNVKRVPTILRRYNNAAINKPNNSVVNNDYIEDLYNKHEFNLFEISNNNTEKKLYKTEFPNVLKNIPSSDTRNMLFEQTKILEPQIGSMKIEDSQEPEIKQRDINICSTKHNGKKEFCRHDDSMYSQTFKTSYNTSAYTEKLPQKQILHDTRKPFYLNNSPIHYLQSVNFSNSNVESAKQFPQQSKSHICEINKQKFCGKSTCDQNHNILFNDDNDKIISTSKFPHNIQNEKRSRELFRETFDNTDIECTKHLISQNACRCNEQLIYSTNYPRKEQMHYLHKKAAESKDLRDTRGYNNSTDNCVNSSNTMQNLPPSLKQKNDVYMYSKAIDNQHHAVLLQNVTQPIKYFAAKSGTDIQRIPVYINDKNIRIAESVPLGVVAVMNPNTQAKAFSQDIATQVIPLQTDGLHFNDFAIRKISDQPFVKHLDSMNTMLINPNSQSNTWYVSNL
ncbi:hypothetical protein P5V15_000980 [Pogonomyrmex californicus]